MRAPATGRFVLLAGVAAVFVALIFDTSPAERRRHELNDLLAAHQLGSLSAEEHNSLAAQVSALAKSIGIAKAIRINQPLDVNSIGVWVTDTPRYPGTASVLNVDRGNAFYDPIVDAVFIDVSLVSTDEQHTIFQNSGYSSVSSFNGAPFVRTLCHFILAHEFGHRQLHRQAAAAFDDRKWMIGLRMPGKAARDREIEADAFGLRALLRFYAESIDRHDGVIEASNAEVYDIDLGNNASGSERAAAEVASAFIMAETAQMYTSSPYSGFYENESHPSIFSRVRSMLGSLSSEARSQLASSSMSTMWAMASHISHIPSVVETEVVAPWPIGSVSATEDSFLLGSADATAQLRVPWRDVQNAARDSVSVRPSVSTSQTLSQAQPESEWSSPNGMLVALTETGRDIKRPRGFPAPYDGTFVVGGPKLVDKTLNLDVWMPRSPAKSCALDLTGLGIEPAALHVTNSVAVPGAVFAMLDADGVLPDSIERDWIRIDPATCEGRVLHIRLPPAVAARWQEGQWSIVRGKDVESLVWIGKGVDASTLEVWLLDGDSSAPIAVPSMAIEGAVSKEPWARRFTDYYIASVVPLSDGLLVNVENRGIYVLRFQQKMVSVVTVSSLGSDIFQIIPLAAGRVAYYFKGGFKAYVAYIQQTRTPAIH